MKLTDKQFKDIYDNIPSLDLIDGADFDNRTYVNKKTYEIEEDNFYIELEVSMYKDVKLISATRIQPPEEETLNIDLEIFIKKVIYKEEILDLTINQERKIINKLKNIAYTGN